MDSTDWAYRGTGTTLYAQVLVYYWQIILDGNSLLGTSIDTGTATVTLTAVNLKTHRYISPSLTVFPSVLENTLSPDQEVLLTQPR